MPISSWELSPRRNGTLASTLAEGRHSGGRSTAADPAKVRWLGTDHVHGYAQP